MIFIEANFNLEGFEQEVNKLLNKVEQSNLTELANMAIADIKQGIDGGYDLYGIPFVSNTVKWIKRKGGTTVYMGRYGRLYDSINIRNATDNQVEISVRSGGTHWQTNPGNMYGDLPQYKRNFFGFSKRFLDRVKEWLNKN